MATVCHNQCGVNSGTPAFTHAAVTAAENRSPRVRNRGTAGSTWRYFRRITWPCLERHAWRLRSANTSRSSWRVRIFVGSTVGDHGRGPRGERVRHELPRGGGEFQSKWLQISIVIQLPETRSRPCGPPCRTIYHFRKQTCPLRALICQKKHAQALPGSFRPDPFAEIQEIPEKHVIWECQCFARRVTVTHVFPSDHPVAAFAADLAFGERTPHGCGVVGLSRIN